MTMRRIGRVTDLLRPTKWMCGDLGALAGYGDRSRRWSDPGTCTATTGTLATPPAPATPTCSYDPTATDTTAPGGFKITSVGVGGRYRNNSGSWVTTRSWSGLGDGTYQGSVYVTGTTNSDRYNTSPQGPNSATVDCSSFTVTHPPVPAGCATAGRSGTYGQSLQQSVYASVCSSISASYNVTSGPATATNYLQAEWQIRWQDRVAGTWYSWQSEPGNSYYNGATAAGTYFSDSWADQRSGAQFRVRFTNYWGETSGWGTTSVVLIAGP